MAVKPSFLRDEDIKTITHVGDFVYVELDNGIQHTMETEAVIQDWLNLNEKFQAARKVAKHLIQEVGK